MNFNNMAMTDPEIAKSLVEEFNASKARADMITGEKYYGNDNDITTRKITCYVDGKEVADETKPNHKLNHAYMKLLVDEKVGYLLGKAPSVTSDNKTFQEKLIEILDDDFDDLINEIGTEASNKGIAWLQPYIDEEGKLQFMIIPAEQVVPVWKDAAHTQLESAIRYYYVEAYFGKTKKEVLKVEWWKEDGVTYYTEFEDELILDVEVEPNPAGHFTYNSEEYGWGKTPFIPFKNNSKEKPDITYVKALIDNYDLNTSDTSNNLAEIQSLIYVLKNYGGQSVSEFMQDLKYYKAIKVDEDGGVDTLQAELNVEAVEKHLDRLKKDIYQFGQGVDMDTDKFGQSPSGVALQFLYSGLDLKCNNMERKFKKAFKMLFWFISEYLKLTNQGTFDSSDAKVSFNRNMISNTTEQITNVSNSTGIISRKSQLENHPFVEDVDEELKRLKEDETSIPPDDLDFNGDGDE